METKQNPGAPETSGTIKEYLTESRSSTLRDSCGSDWQFLTGALKFRMGFLVNLIELTKGEAKF